MKICTKCSKTLPLSSFNKDKSKKDGLRPSCKACKRKSDKKYRENNLEKLREKDREYAKLHREEAKLRASKFYYSDVEGNKEKRRQWYIKNKDGLVKRYRETHKDEIRSYMREYLNDKYQSDFNFRIYRLVSGRIVKSLKSEKMSKTIELLGCSIDFYKSWLEFQFDEKMTWDNHGSYWHIDHVKPCASYDLSDEDQQKECFCWKNTRPCEKIENIVKNSKIDIILIESHKQIVNDFLLTVPKSD